MAVRANGSSASRRILEGATPENVDCEKVLHARRKSAMVSLLSEFEHQIAPHIRPGHEKAIEDFKRSCRQKLNALTWEAVELMKLEPGETMNGHAVDLAQLAFGDNDGGQAKP